MANRSAAQNTSPSKPVNAGDLETSGSCPDKQGGGEGGDLAMCSAGIKDSKRNLIPTRHPTPTPSLAELHENVRQKFGTRVLQEG
jgi:hypothetical protein